MASEASAMNTKGDITMITKPNTIAIVAILAALATSGAAPPAFARDNQTPRFDSCFLLSVERGSGPQKGGGDKELSQHRAFMQQCMAGKIPVNLEANYSVVQLPANAHASTVNGHTKVQRLPRTLESSYGYAPGRAPQYDSTGDTYSSYSQGHQSFPNPDRDFSIENLRSHAN